MQSFNELPPAEILDESVFAFILVLKSGQFLCIKEGQLHSSPCLAYRAFCTVSIRVWGIVYLMQGLSRASEQINEMLHTFFIYTIPSGAGVQYITDEKVFGIIRLCSSFLCRL